MSPEGGRNPAVCAVSATVLTYSMSDDYYEPPDQNRVPRRPSEIGVNEMVEGLHRLTFFADNMFLRTQALNLAVVDKFIMDLELATLRKNFREELTLEDSMFLSAQTQMWLFAAYELLRTWKDRAKKIVSLHKNGGLDHKIAALGIDRPHVPIGNVIYADQLKKVKADPCLITRLEHDVDLIHVTFELLSYVRVALAKHETQGPKRGRPSGSSTMGRADRYTGSVSYEMTDGPSIWGYVSRRDIAEGMRGFATATVQSKDELADFDRYMKGPSAFPEFGEG